ncbi:MAG: DUF4258 domain-containing protein [Thermodesulfobacteriota bacterium]|nr:DUF4258 domain-containing protein [Thermodesulfobacteriota bacterium]
MLTLGTRFGILGNVKSFNWSPEKNERLKRERGVSFEQVVFCIEGGRLLDVLEHPQPGRYKNQKLYVVDIDNYAYIVPFVDEGDERFLKTVFPSRKYTRLYLHKEK